MLNLVHQGTVDETVYERLSERMRDRYDLFGALPDTIRDDWIDDIATLGAEMDRYIDARRRATGFDIRYQISIEPGEADWRDCAARPGRRDAGGMERLSGRGSIVAEEQLSSYAEGRHTAWETRPRALAPHLASLRRRPPTKTPSAAWTV